MPSETDYSSRKEAVCLRGDPLFILPVTAFATEYENDIGWDGRKLLDSFSPRLRAMWGLCETASVFGTMALAFLEVYFVMNGVFLSIGIVALLVWATWLIASRIFWERSFGKEDQTSIIDHLGSSKSRSHPIQA